MVKGHTSSVASLGQHAVKVVFTAGREEPKTPRHAEKVDKKWTKKEETIGTNRGVQEETDVSFLIFTFLSTTYLLSSA